MALRMLRARRLGGVAFELISFSARTPPLQLYVAGVPLLPQVPWSWKGFVGITISGTCPPGGVRLWGITECSAF